LSKRIYDHELECPKCETKCEFGTRFCPECGFSFTKTQEGVEQLYKYVDLPNKERERVILKAIVDNGLKQNKIGPTITESPKSYMFTIRQIRWRLFSTEINNTTWAWRESASKVSYSCNQLVKQGLLARGYNPKKYCYFYFLSLAEKELETIFHWIKIKEFYCGEEDCIHNENCNCLQKYKDLDGDLGCFEERYPLQEVSDS